MRPEPESMCAIVSQSLSSLGTIPNNALAFRDIFRMILPERREELFHKSGPCERTALLKIILIWVVVKGLNLKWIVPVSNVMALSVHSCHDIEESIEYPMKDEKHFHLL